MRSALFINCKVWQPNGTFDEAFGIDENHFNFVGSADEAASIKSSYKQIIDLEGKLVLPGLIDGHLHLIYGSVMRKRFDASEAADSETLKDKINNYAANNPGQEWIIGSNLNLNNILKQADPKIVNFADDIFPDSPLFITNYDYHSALCNSKAMLASGIMKKLNEFSDSEVMKNSEGKPNGVIKEKALNYIFEQLPNPAINEKVTAAEEFIKILHSYGITSVSDITLIEDLEVYNELYNLGKLNIRVNSYIPFAEFNNIKIHSEFTKEINRDFYTINGFKAFWDGTLGSETALFSQNYAGKNHNGYKTDMIESGEIYRLAKEINNSGSQMIIHAIGDRAVTEVLDLYESLFKPGNNSRHRIEHAQHINENDFERFKKYGVIASVQPIHLKYDTKTVKEKLPAKLKNSTHNYKKLIDNDAIVNFGTDFPIVEVNPFENIRLALTRKTNDEEFFPEYCIDLHSCIKAYTINNAYSNFNENAVGSITKGKAADFVIMEDDLFKIENDKFTYAKVWKTFLDGKEVYSLH